MGHRPQGARGIHQGGGHMDGGLDRFGTLLARVHRFGARRKHWSICIDSTKEEKFDIIEGRYIIPRQNSARKNKKLPRNAFFLWEFFYFLTVYFLFYPNRIFRCTT